MAGKKNAADRKPTIEAMADVKAQLSRMAHANGWTVAEFTDYVIRMGVNRCLTLERDRAKREKGAKNKPAKKAVAA